jgi:large subunit ribosomal protein L21
MIGSSAGTFHEDLIMYAVIKTGSKQYKVQAGDIVRVEKLDAEEGKTIKISDVLMLVDNDKVTVGTPQVKGATVSGKVNAHGRGQKVRIVKFRRRKHHRKQMGHRQAYTELSILKIDMK